MAIGQLLRRWWPGKAAQPSDLVTGIVGPEKDGGWSALFISDGRAPDDVRAWTLTDVADNAAAAVAALYAQHLSVEGAELALAIYPWDYDQGPMFDISGQPGAYVARDIEGSDLHVHGASLEDLVTAVSRMPDPIPTDSMFRWVRPIASLPIPPMSPIST